MARLISATVTSTGTIWPSLMYWSIILPVSSPLLRASLSRSPADRWTKAKSRTMLAHCVPLPAPGPPSTKTTFGRPVDEVGAAAVAELPVMTVAAVRLVAAVLDGAALWAAVDAAGAEW